MERQPPLNPLPLRSTSPLGAGNIITDRDALPYIHSEDRINVNKMLTGAERRIGLFEGATPPIPPTSRRWTRNIDPT